MSQPANDPLREDFIISRDKMVGTQFEKGLANLKTLSERII